ncbi:MAG: DUF2784 domain-containing protein [Nitrospinota bacterium]|nr:DUF2784 domain-containing protein [Nitrospinota bacterium]
MRVGLALMDYLLHAIHLGVIFICLAGWIFEPTRIVHLAVVVLVAISWFGLGYFFEYGYCFLTDTQWRVKRKLGQEPHTESYVKYVLDKITGLDIDLKITDNLTLYAYIAAVILSLVVNLTP